MANELRRHKRADAVKWVVVFLLILGAIAAIVVLAVKLDRQTTVTRLGAEAYSVGTLDENGDAQTGDASIVTRQAFTVDGLKVEIKDGATVMYTLYFYDEDGDFISKTSAQSKDYDGVIPENADTAKIVITPTEDEDGKVTLAEIVGYAGQVTVTVNR